MKILLIDDGPAISKLGSFRMAGPGSLAADSCLTTAARGVQAQVEEALAEKQGPSILVVALKDLEKLDIGVDPRKTGDCDSMP